MKKDLGIDPKSVIRRAKEAYGVKTDIQLANKMGVTSSAVWRWGTIVMPIAVCIQVARETGRQMNWLVLGEETTSFDSAIRLPYYDIAASAGYGLTAIDNPEYTEVVIDSNLMTALHANESETGIVNNKGDSMKGVIEDGDLLIYDKSQREPVDGKIFLLGIENDMFVKYMQRSVDGWFAVSTNKDFEPIPITRQVRVIGRVVGSIKKL